MSSAPSRPTFVATDSARRRTLRLAAYCTALVLLSGAPAVVLLARGTPIVQPWMLGLLVGLIGSISSTRLAVIAAPVVGVLCGVGTLLGAWPWSGGLLLAVLAYAAARTAQQGIDAVTMFMMAIIGIATFTRPELLGPGVRDLPLVDGAAWANAGLLAALITGSALWTILIWTALSRGLPTAPARPVPVESARTYALVAAALVGTAAVLGLALLPPRAGGWVIVTLAVVLRPSVTATRDRARHRVGGTTLGVVVAAALAWLIPWPTATMILAQMLLIIALVVRLDGRIPYWVYAATVAQVVVLSDPVHAASTVQQRLGATLLGGAMAMVAAVVVDAWLTGRHPALVETDRP